MANPICSCGEESTWIDNGPRLQYHYCRDCKVEVSESFYNVPANYELGTISLDKALKAIGYVAPTVINVPSPPPLPHKVLKCSSSVYVCIGMDHSITAAHLLLRGPCTMRVVPMRDIIMATGYYISVNNNLHGYDFSQYPEYKPTASNPVPTPSPQPVATPHPVHSAAACYTVTLVDLARRVVHLEATTINTTRVVPLNTVTYILNRSPGISDKITGYDFSLYPRYNPAPLTTPGQHQFDPNTGNCDACGAKLGSMAHQMPCPGAAPNLAASPQTVQPRCRALISGVCQYVSHTASYDQCRTCGRIRAGANAPSRPIP